MNLLILSCGTRNKLVRFFKESGFDKVVVTDCSKLAPALFEADTFYIVPRMDHPDYLKTILEICKKEKIQGILPLQEDELLLIAENKELFASRGIIPIVSTAQAITICRDKMKFYRYMQENQIPMLPSYETLSEFEVALKVKKETFPVFVKPICGAGSIGAMKVKNMELLKALLHTSEEPLLIQHFSSGKEYGADIYVDLLSGKVTDIFVKEKIRMRAGETEKSVSVKNEKLSALIQKTVQCLPLSGPVDMDIFEIEGEFYVSEINPRFGGGYPHAYACSISFPQNIMKNLAGEENPDNIGNYQAGVYVMKYSDIVVKETI